MSENAGRADVPSTDRLTALWRRLKDHRIAQWTVGYVAVAYGIQHAVTLTSEALDWPHTVTRVSMILLALGLPIAMTLAWYHGERATRRVSAGELSIVSLLLVVISFAFYALVRPAPIIIASSSSAVQEASVAAARQASLSPATAISLAVMPFDNLSPDPTQGYFVDGMGDEIITALAKIPDLRVVGRESALQFKGKHENFRDAGRALNATHLLEGSVRKAGDELRISAELVRADTGATVWANSYDRQLKDVFAVQEDIARAIAASLHMTLQLKPGEDLVNQRTGSASLHDEYLRARNLVRGDQIDDAIKLLNDFVAREPGYAPAWAELAIAHNEKLNANADLNNGSVAAALPVMRENRANLKVAAEQALKLDPNNSQAICAAASSRDGAGDVVAGMEMYQRALAVDPDEPDCLESYGLQLAHLGMPGKGLEVMKHLVAVEPLLPAFRLNFARVLYVSGQTDDAVAIWKGLPGPAPFALSLALASQGHVPEAADLLENSPALKRFSKNVAVIVKVLRNTPAPPGAPELGVFDLFYAFADAPERVMGTFEDHLRAGYTGGGQNGWEWTPGFRAVRQTARFKAYIRDSGILAYWKANGWPDLCHPTTGDNFECS